jgi:hypothetical protein
VFCAVAVGGEGSRRTGLHVMFVAWTQLARGRTHDGSTCLLRSDPEVDESLDMD